MGPKVSIRIVTKWQNVKRIANVTKYECIYSHACFGLRNMANSIISIKLSMR